MAMLPTHMPWLRLFCVSSAVYETANRRQPSHRDKPIHTPLGRDLFHRFCKENVLDLPFLRKPGFKSNHKLQKQSNGFVYKRRSGPLSKRKNFFFFFLEDDQTSLFTSGFLQLHVSPPQAGRTASAPILSQQWGRLTASCC